MLSLSEHGSTWERSEVTLAMRWPSTRCDSHSTQVFPVDKVTQVFGHNMPIIYGGHRLWVVKLSRTGEFGGCPIWKHGRCQANLGCHTSSKYSGAGVPNTYNILHHSLLSNI